MVGRSFQGGTRMPVQSIFTPSVINMAKELQMTTVAEGVEDQKQSDLHRELPEF